MYIKVGEYMKFEKIIEKLGSFISEFVDEINPDIEIGFDNYAYCYTDEPYIAVGLYTADNEIDKLHENYYKENGFDFTEFGISFRTFTLLHEIGHIETITTETEESEHYAKQEEINDNVKLNGEPINDTLLKYFNLPLEILADKWAWNYLKENIFKIKIFDNIFKKLIEKLKESE